MTKPKPKLYTEAYLESAKKKAYEKGRKEATVELQGDFKCLADTTREVIKELKDFFKI